MRYFLETNQTIKMPKSAENTIAEEILSNYTFGRKLNIEYTNDNCITIGNYKKADFGEGEGVINITDEGVYIGGRDYPGLMHGFFSFENHNETNSGRVSVSHLLENAIDFSKFFWCARLP